MSSQELSQPGEIQDQIESAITGTNPTPQNGSGDVFADALLKAMKIDQPQEEPADDGKEEGDDPERSRPDSEGRRLQPEADASASEHPAGDEGEQGEASPEDLRQQKLTDLAKELGTNAQRLYSIEVDMGKEGSMSIGALKDAYRAQEPFRAEMAQREQALMEQAIQLREAQQTVMSLQEDIQQHVDPGKLETLREQQQAALAVEGQRLRQAAPELAEEAAFGKFREDLVGFMGSYGFKPQELNIADHRILLVLKDAMEMRQRWKRLAEAKPEPLKRKPAKPKAVDTSPPPKREQLGRHPQDDVDRMAQLLMR